MFLQVKNQRVIAKRTSSNYEIWTRCNNPKTDMIISNKGSGTDSPK